VAASRSIWGEIEEGAVHRFALANGDGLRIEVSDLGATLLSVVVPDAGGKLADVVLGYDEPSDYIINPGYFGATVGRYGNRIRAGAFALDGEIHGLACNEPPNHLHGGWRGFDKRIWTPHPDPGANAVRFTLVSDDGEEGYPGALVAETRYQLGEDNSLRIDMTASVSRPCPVNLVHHTYWNLAGHGSGTVLGQELEIAGDFYTPTDRELLPTGEVRPVAGTAFDFTAAKPIGRDIAGVTLPEGVFDHNWVLRGAPGQLRRAAAARDPASGRAFELQSTEPGLQFYAAGHLDGSPGKDGARYPRYAGFALESQKFPDSPNIGHFPSARLDPGQVYRHTMLFKFTW
jgi:aldose 1-epimerase